MMGVVILPRRNERWVWDAATVDASNASFGSLTDLAHASRLSEDAPPFLAALLDLLLDHLYVLRIFSIAHAAGVTFARLKPSKFYLLQAAALTTIEIEQRVIQIAFRHGWPILSLVDVASPSMTEAAEASSLGRGGVA